MLARWPIRNKLLLGITLLLVIVATLSLSGFVGVYAYRGLVKSLRSRADELPLATALSQQMSDLRTVLVAANAERLSGEVLQPETTHKLIEEEFQVRFLAVENTLAEYRRQLATNDDERIGDTEQELGTASEIDQSLAKIAALTTGSSWGIDRTVSQQLNLELERAQTLTAQLPSHLHRRLGVLAGEVRAQYRALIAANAIATLLAAALLALFIRLFYRWVFQPLRQLIQGSRQVAAGDFSYRIRLDSQDEMARAGRVHERNDDSLPSRFATISTGRCRFARVKSSAASNLQASVFWRPELRMRSTTRWRASRCAPSRWRADWRRLILSVNNTASCSTTCK